MKSFTGPEPKAKGPHLPPWDESLFVIGGEILAVASRGNASNIFSDYDKGANRDNPEEEKLIGLAAKHRQIVIR